jgi:3-carboxy-cis,cis-muconate cycloisomerase
VLAEAVAARLSPYVGRRRAQSLVADATRSDGPFRAALLALPEVGEHLGPDGVDAALDPTAWLGCADALVDRAVAAHRKGDR